MKRLLKRLSEPSSWAGISILLGLMGLTGEQTQPISVAGQAVALATSAVTAAVSVVTSEKGQSEGDTP